MKKSYLYATALLGCLLVGHAHLVSAEETDNGDHSSIQSNAYVGITKNDGEDGEGPVNPIDPEKPVTPWPGEEGEENPHPPSTKGPLSLNYISNLRFGMNKASGNDVTYQVKPDKVVDEEGKTIEVPNYVQVTDNRGTNAGWTLTVKQDQAFMNGSNTLKGTEMNFKNPVAVGKSGKVDTAPSVNANFTLSADGTSALVMVAKTDQGMGTWIDRFGNSTEQASASITLMVPGESKKVAGQYKTSLTWTLSDVPVGND